MILLTDKSGTRAVYMCLKKLKKRIFSNTYIFFKYSPVYLILLLRSIPLDAVANLTCGNIDIFYTAVATYINWQATHS